MRMLEHMSSQNVGSSSLEQSSVATPAKAFFSSGVIVWSTALTSSAKVVLKFISDAALGAALKGDADTALNGDAALKGEEELKVRLLVCTNAVHRLWNLVGKDVTL